MPVAPQDRRQPPSDSDIGDASESAPARPRRRPLPPPAEGRAGVARRQQGPGSAPVGDAVGGLGAVSHPDEVNAQREAGVGEDSPASTARARPLPPAPVSAAP